MFEDCLSSGISPPLTLCNTSYKWLTLVEKTTRMKQVNLTSQHDTHLAENQHGSTFCCESKSQLVARRKLKENKAQVVSEK